MRQVSALLFPSAPFILKKTNERGRQDEARAAQRGRDGALQRDSGKPFFTRKYHLIKRNKWNIIWMKWKLWIPDDWKDEINEPGIAFS
jgi:hypothetical protein